jgi:hypothetical protein
MSARHLMPLLSLLLRFGGSSSQPVPTTVGGATPPPPLVVASLPRIGASNASDQLRAHDFTLILISNQYCADCGLIRQRMAAAATILRQQQQQQQQQAQQARPSVPTPAGGGVERRREPCGLVEADTTTDKNLLRAFGVRETPTILVHRSSGAASSSWWPCDLALHRT